LDVGCAATSSARERRDVVVFYIRVTAAAFAGAAVSAEYEFFGSFRDVSALRQAA